MLFHSIQTFYVIPREDRKQLTHLQAIYVHISGLTCLSHFCCLLFPTGQGRSSVVSGSEWGVQEWWWGTREWLWGALSPRGLPSPGVLRQRPWASWVKQAGKQLRGMLKSNPPSPTRNQPKVCSSPLFHSCCWRWWRAGRNSSFTECQDQGSQYPREQEPGTETDRMEFHRD